MANIVGFDRFNSILHGVDTIENGNPVKMNAECGMYIDFHSDRYYRTYRFLLPFLGTDGRSILDIGLSPYFTTTLCYLTGSNSVGVWGGCRLDGTKDEKQVMNLTTRHNGAEYAIPIHIGYDCESDRLPFDDNTFDIVLFLEIIEHLISDPVFALKELARVLKPDGVIILTTDNSHSLIQLLKIMTMKPIYWPYNDTMFGDRHNREYMKNEIRLLLEGIGYRDVNVQLKNLSRYAAGYYPVKKKIGYAISNIITNFPYLSNFKRQIFAYARKGAIRDFYPGWLFMRREGWLESQLR